MADRCTCKMTKSLLGEYRNHDRECPCHGEAAVRRVTSMDDIRKGQLVAVLPKRSGRAGVFEVEAMGAESFIAVDPGTKHSATNPGEHVILEQYNVTILRDPPPASPVTVRRDLWDEFENAWSTYSHHPGLGTKERAYNAAHALIDNADTGGET